MSAYIDNLYKNSSYFTRPARDSFFSVPVKAESDSEAFKAVRFIEEKQLMRRDLWKLFAGQFATQPDAPNSGWRGEYWGKMMRGGCFVWSLTRSPELYDVLKEAVQRLLATAGEDGRISSYPRDDEFKGWDMWSRKYVLLGLEYFSDICPEEDFKAEILRAECRHLDYIIDHIGEEEGKKSILQTSSHWGCINSCSILEPVIKLYNLTGNRRYREFADYIVSTGGSNMGNMLEFALKNEVPPYKYPVVKAYETMSFFEGILEYYRITGNRDYLQAVINFTDAVLETDYTVIGNCGCTHELFDNSTVHQTEVITNIMQETCVAVTLSKLLGQVLCLTGDARYADAMERTFYNTILGAINFEGNTHLIRDKIFIGEGYDHSAEFVKSIGGFAFDSYSPLYKSRRNRKTAGYQKIEGGTAYGCCACIGAAGVARLPLAAFMMTHDGIVINHYLDGRFGVPLPDGTQAEFTLKTAYPYGGSVEIGIHCEAGKSFPLMLRIPSWSRGFVMSGCRADIAKAGGYYTVEVCDGAGISLCFDNSTRTETLNGKTAVLRGCILLAIDNRNENTDAVAGRSIVSDTDAPHDFKCRVSRDITFDNGTCIRMEDYASCGSDWDNADRIITAWVDTEA